MISMACTITINVRVQWHFGVNNNLYRKYCASNAEIIVNEQQMDIESLGGYHYFVIAYN